MTFRIPELEGHCRAKARSPVGKEDSRWVTSYTKTTKEKDRTFGAPDEINYWKVEDAESGVQITGVMREGEDLYACLKRIKSERTI